MGEVWEVAKWSLAVLSIVTLAAVWFSPICLKVLRMLKREGIFLAFFALAMLCAMATKPAQSKFTFEAGLRDNGSYSTNSTVYVGWTLASLIPSSAPVYIEYREKADTNGVYHALGESTIGARSWRTDSWPVATNYDYNIWYYYIPPAPVHTNGVWEYRTMKARDERFALPIRARIEGDGAALATPKQKREEKDE